VKNNEKIYKIITLVCICICVFVLGYIAFSSALNGRGVITPSPTPTRNPITIVTTPPTATPTVKPTPQSTERTVRLSAEELREIGIDAMSQQVKVQSLEVELYGTGEIIINVGIDKNSLVSLAQKQGVELTGIYKFAIALLPSTLETKISMEIKLNFGELEIIPKGAKVSDMEIDVGLIPEESIRIMNEELNKIVCPADEIITYFGIEEGNILVKTRKI